MQRYWVEAGDVCSANERGITWRGRPDGMPVQIAVTIPGTDDAAVLLEADSGPRDALGKLQTWPNLLRIRPTGKVVWRIAADGVFSGGRDWWTSVQIVDGSLTASTWSCYYQTLNPKNGRVVSSIFTK